MAWRVERSRTQLPQTHRPQTVCQELSFRLEAEQAAYLREQVVTRCPDSLIAFVLRERFAIDEALFPWQLVVELPDHLHEWIAHGRNFSEVMWGAQLLYNLMLAEQRKRSDCRNAAELRRH